MRLEILHVPDCPGAEALKARLAPLLHRQPNIEVSWQVVTTESQARARGMAGSPTLLIDGADPFARPGQAVSLACRLYPGGDDGPAPAPSQDQLAAVWPQDP
jgi:hypothetical protein